MCAVPSFSPPSGPDRSRYVLTEEGRTALRDADTCQCTWSFDGGLIVCLDCGTVFSTKATMASRFDFYRNGSHPKRSND